MIFWTTKVNQRTSVYCFNPQCKVNPLYFEEPSHEGWKPFIKEGTIVGYISLGSTIHSYCQECLVLVYQECKAAFDSNLWVFK